MKAVFADTSFYVASVSPRDVAHDAAVEFTQGYRGDTVTTEYVLVELGNWLAHVGDRAVFVALKRCLYASRKTLVVPAESSLFEAGFELYAQRLDKNWSLTDCISFVVMGRFNLTDALTGDHHFKQAGFKALLL